jgi:hypothetical protein
MGLLDGKVAIAAGPGRGLGREHVLAPGAGMGGSGAPAVSAWLRERR